MGSSMAERGTMTDEAIAVMKELWTEEDPSFQGRYNSFSGMKFSPKPLQKPHIPFLIGGVSRAARLPMPVDLPRWPATEPRTQDRP